MLLSPIKYFLYKINFWTCSTTEEIEQLYYKNKKIIQKQAREFVYF